MGAPGTPNEKQNGSNKDQNGAFFGVLLYDHKEQNCFGSPNFIAQYTYGK